MRFFYHQLDRSGSEDFFVKKFGNSKISCTFASPVPAEASSQCSNQAGRFIFYHL